MLWPQAGNDYTNERTVIRPGNCKYKTLSLTSSYNPTGLLALPKNFYKYKPHRENIYIPFYYQFRDGSETVPRRLRKSTTFFLKLFRMYPLTFPDLSAPKY